MDEMAKIVFWFIFCLVQPLRGAQDPERLFDPGLLEYYLGRNLSFLYGRRGRFQGDIPGITVNSYRRSSSNIAHNVLTDGARRWPGGKVPYWIDPSFGEPQQHMILSAMQVMSLLTDSCVMFAPKREDTDDYINFISVGDFEGCSSSVGRVGGPQNIHLSPGCMDQLGGIQHEIMHALGFYHEMSRFDRDQYVDIIWDNVLDDQREQFKAQVGDTLDVEYDYQSVLHYPMNAFPIDPCKPTIVPKAGHPEGRLMGQNCNLSPKDVRRIRSAYSCLGLRSPVSRGFSLECHQATASDVPRPDRCGSKNDTSLFPTQPSGSSVTTPPVNPTVSASVVTSATTTSRASEGSIPKDQKGAPDTGRTPKPESSWDSFLDRLGLLSQTGFLKLEFVPTGSKLYQNTNLPVGSSKTTPSTNPSSGTEATPSESKAVPDENLTTEVAVNVENESTTRTNIDAIDYNIAEVVPASEVVVDHDESWKPPPGFFCRRSTNCSPDPRNCSRFIQCKDNVPLVKECSAGLYYIVAAGRCGAKHYSNCTARNPELLQSTTSTYTQQQETDADSSTSPTEVGKTESMTETNRLTHPTRISVASSIQRAESWIPPPGFACHKGNGVYPDPRNCSRFIECIGRLKFVKECFPGLLFNNETGGCDWPQTTFCPLVPEYLQPPRKYTCESADGYFEDPRSFSTYIVCKGKIPTVKGCPSQMYYLVGTEGQCVSPPPVSGHPFPLV